MSSGAKAAARRLLGALVLAGVGIALVGGCGDGSSGGGDTLSSSSLSAEARRGRQVASDKGCTSCHTSDGSRGTGPTWQRIWGTTVELDGGGTASVDRAYVTRSIRDPGADVVDSYPAIMPNLDLSDGEIDAVIAYIQALG